MGLQAGAALPLVPLTLEREGVDKLTIGIVTATWAIGMLTFGTRIPRLASRFGTVPKRRQLSFLTHDSLDSGEPHDHRQL